jgi:hypothetical protein
MRWLSMAIPCGVLFAGALAMSASADTFVIRPDGSGDFPTIQAALSSPLVASGDEIVLADGVFTGPGNRDLDLGEKELIIRSASDVPQRCVIDGEGAHRGFWIHGNQTQATQIHGLTIRNAYAAGACPFCSGAGILCADSLQYSNGASPLIDNCIFRECVAEETGAALFSNVYSVPLLRGCRFTANQAREGGAVLFNTGLADSPCIIEDCFFDANSAERGGALMNVHGGPQSEDYAVIVEGSVFRNNQATGVPPGYRKPAAGGAAYFWNGHALVSGCTLYGNDAVEQAGGIFVDHATHLDVYNTIVMESSGKGIGCDATSAIDDMACCDLYANSGGDWVGCVEQYRPALMPSNLSADPAFCDPVAANFHLTPGSLCLPTPTCTDGIGAFVTTCSHSDISESVAHPATPRLVTAPNPCLSTTRLRFSVAPGMAHGPVRLTIHDVTGRCVRTLMDGAVAGGEQEITWDGRDEDQRMLPPGAYFCRLEAGGQDVTQPIILVR